MKDLEKKNASLALISIQVLVVIMVSSNLRSPITSVGPVLSQLSESLQLSNFQSSLLTSIPLFMFATCSVLVSRMSLKISINRFLGYGMLVLTLGLLLRVSGSVAMLFLGSVLIGLGICIGNVITPGYIKNNFPKQLGIMTGIFAVAMNLTAALASGFSAGIGKATGLGWQGSLGLWTIGALFALLVVGVELLLTKRSRREDIATLAQSSIHVFKSAQAWNISIFMGLQSLIFYSIVSWLPAVLVDFGMQAGEPGWVLFTIQFAMLPITFVGPILANKMKDQRAMIIFVCMLMLASVFMFAFLQSRFIYLTAILLGLSNGLSFSLSILFFSLRTKSSATAIKLSGMAQSIGYLIAAFGPPIFGKLHDWDASWKCSFYFLALAVVCLFFFGMRAAGKKFVED
ncbi:CynX/NimT family MFS transporter [Sphingobacterium sp. Mn56C]|uniref:CynX/NimT family MFS transporter n=1 Tax=Sphingobacterium sp. Mn56C TaxID=3395261 RepID=UPI003BE5F08E